MYVSSFLSPSQAQCSGFCHLVTQAKKIRSDSGRPPGVSTLGSLLCPGLVSVALQGPRQHEGCFTPLFAHMNEAVGLPHGRFALLGGKPLPSESPQGPNTFQITGLKVGVSRDVLLSLCSPRVLSITA